MPINVTIEKLCSFNVKQYVKKITIPRLGCDLDKIGPY